MSELIRTFSKRGDLAHLSLFLWANLGLGARLVRAQGTRGGEGIIGRLSHGARSVCRPQNLDRRIYKPA
jgi:hypothetical protein